MPTQKICDLATKLLAEAEALFAEVRAQYSVLPDNCPEDWRQAAELVERAKLFLIKSITDAINNGVDLEPYQPAVVPDEDSDDE